jgi:hypothetical protein
MGVQLYQKLRKSPNKEDKDMKKTVVKTLVTRNRHFTIIRHESGMYCAIEDKYITDGKLNTKLNGLQMHANFELDGCINDTINDVELEYLESKGYTKAEALSKVFNMPIEICEKLYK